MPTLKAMPDRLILKFPPAVEKLRGIIVPGNFALRPEIGELVDIGEALSEETRRIRIEIIRRAQAGHKFIVPMATGTSYWRKELEGKGFDFLQDVRSYRISEIATSIAEGDG